jgi:hypothetical protein
MAVALGIKGFVIGKTFLKGASGVAARPENHLE